MVAKFRFKSCHQSFLYYLRPISLFAPTNLHNNAEWYNRILLRTFEEDEIMNKTKLMLSAGLVLIAQTAFSQTEQNYNGAFIDNDALEADFVAKRDGVGKYARESDLFSFIPPIICTSENKEDVLEIGLKGIPHTPCPE